MASVTVCHIDRDFAPMRYQWAFVLMEIVPSATAGVELPGSVRQFAGDEFQFFRFWQELNGGAVSICDVRVVFGQDKHASVSLKTNHQVLTHTLCQRYNLRFIKCPQNAASTSQDHTELPVCPLPNR